MKSIIHSVTFEKPATDVMAALTTQDGLSGWWSTSVDAGSSVGEEVVFQFLLGEFNPVMRIEEMTETRLAWSSQQGHPPWDGSTFSFDLTPTEDGCELLFRMEYDVELPDAQYGTYNFNWAYYLESLRMLVNDGAGKPFEFQG